MPILNICRLVYPFFCLPFLLIFPHRHRYIFCVEKQTTRFRAPSNPLNHPQFISIIQVTHSTEAFCFWLVFSPLHLSVPPDCAADCCDHRLHVLFVTLTCMHTKQASKITIKSVVINRKFIKRGNILHSLLLFLGNYLYGRVFNVQKLSLSTPGKMVDQLRGRLIVFMSGPRGTKQFFRFLQI